MIQDSTVFGSDISPLTKLFVERCGRMPNPFAAMSSLVQDLRAQTAMQGPLRLEPLLPLRNIVEFTIVNDMSCDGRLEPKTSFFAGGFLMSIRRDMSSERIRFTIAHELCHTFFYELVPEMKFISNGMDKQEERLCNFGAAELLLPTSQVLDSASGLAASIKSLRLLASTYGVSAQAMFLRLRSLSLWKCQMSVWSRMTNGDILLDRFYGGRRVDWHWEDEDVVRRALIDDEHTVFSGRTFIGFRDETGHNRVTPVYYQATRAGDSVLALWNRTAFARDTKPDYLLPFVKGRKLRGRHIAMKSAQSQRAPQSDATAKKKGA